MSRLFRWFSSVLLVLLLLLGGAVLVAYLYNASKVRSWKKTPQLPGKMVKITNYKVYTKVKGTAPPTVVIFPALGSTSFEWGPIQDQLSKTMRVVVYDRGGYGWSQVGPPPRTSKKVVAEANTLLSNLNIAPPYIVVGHSIGAYYAQHFARLRAKSVVGVMLLDPVADHNKWKSKLPNRLFKRFVDKSLFIKRGRTLAKFGLFRMLTVLPKTLDKEQKRNIVEVYSNPASYKIFLDEYLSLYRISFSRWDKLPPFPKIPLTLLYHDSERAVKRMVKFKTDPVEAQRIETVGMELAREYLKLSPKSRWVVAENSNHQIHLDRPELVLKELKQLAQAALAPPCRRKAVVPRKPTQPKGAVKANPSSKPASRPATTKPSAKR
ncbi:MAG: alpha/beta hydrolase [Deltaproteobacteria bacterium]|nr:MAG: alpha/beta hydrolase [Deltaproteobacteria bacterium]